MNAQTESRLKKNDRTALIAVVVVVGLLGILFLSSIRPSVVVEMNGKPIATVEFQIGTRR